MSFDSQFSTLADICSDINYGYTESATTDPIGPKFLRITDIQGGSFDWDRVPFCPASDADTKKYKLEVGDIVVARTGNSTGENAQVTNSPPPAVFASYLIRFRPDASLINPFFVGYQLRSGRFRQYVLSVRGGSAQPGANAKQLGAFPIERIPRSLQDFAVDTLRSIDERITLLRETNATLEAIAQALFKSWFVDFDPVHAKAAGLEPEGMDAATAALFSDSFEESELGLVPRGWKIARLGDVTERITKGTTPTTLKRPFVESGINFVKVESLTDDGQFLPDKFAYIDDETHQLLSRSQLKPGDVLITIAGTIGRVAVMTDDFIPANTNQAVALVRPEVNGFPSSFISQFLRLSGSKAQMGERVVQAVQANLSLGSLSDMRLVMPPADVVKKLHEAVFGVIESNKNSNQRRIRTLAQLRDTLLPRLISGQLRLPEMKTSIENMLSVAV